MSPKDKIPTSRVRRSAKVGRLAAGQAAKQLGTKTANLARSDEAANVALEKRQVEAAEQIVAALGTMKGAAMKLGQVMSFLDVGLVPEPYREEFQRKLGELRDAAPKVRFEDMRKVIESDLEEPLEDTFESFEEEPIAAASIGQVYRATLPGGRPVAVKVQYPGVNDAVRADMQNLGIILRLMKRVAPGIDVKAIGEEVRARIYEELDYELEAQNQRSMARIYRGHPFIVIPDVLTRLSRERVIVQEFVSGRGFEELKRLPQDERDRIGEIVFRFFFGSLYRHRQFSGDPHPGNFLLLDDGRMAFLDFGLFKRMSDEAVEFELRCQRAYIEGDGETLHAPVRRARLHQRPQALHPRGADGADRRLDLVVVARRDRRPRPGHRDEDRDRDVRPALQPLPRDAPRVPAVRAPVRAARRDADHGCAVAAAGARQLPSHRVGVDHRRASRHGAGRAGGLVLRARCRVDSRRSYLAPRRF